MGNRLFSKRSLLIRELESIRRKSVESEPSLTKSELKADLGLSWRTADYHLHLLRGRQALKFHRVYARLHLFSPEVPDEVVPMLASLGSQQ